jgi:hypothetical protein
MMMKSYSLSSPSAFYCSQLIPFAVTCRERASPNDGGEDSSHSTRISNELAEAEAALMIIIVCHIMAATKTRSIKLPTLALLAPRLRSNVIFTMR